MLHDASSVFVMFDVFTSRQSSCFFSGVVVIIYHHCVGFARPFERVARG
jgi:hypothetical protein